jgi:hypothetical protein
MERSGFCRDVLTTAMEGGSDYWAKGRNSKHEPGGGGRYLSIEVKDAEDPEDPWHLVDEDKIAAAVNKIITDPDLKIRTDLKANIAGAWATNDAGQIDCEGADVIVQIAAYGEIVFG